jgi:putative membrane protein
MKFKGLLAVVCAAGLMAGCNSRTSNTIATGNEAGTTGTAGAGVSTSDKNFVNHMMADGSAELDLARLAQDHAASPEVKQFAQMMIDDHTKAGDQLK